MINQTILRRALKTAQLLERKGKLVCSAVSLSVFLGVTACNLLSPEEPGALVPPTTSEDAALPQLRIKVAERERAIHLQTFGEPDRPLLMILHGGPGADFRLLLPLQELADRYYVVLWDQRGAGLSERVTKEELTLDSFNEEISAVQAAVAPGRKVTLVGHSYGGLLATRYAATYPDAVEQLVLIEPGPITPRGRRNYHGGEIGFAAVEDFFWQNELLTSSDHAAADYKANNLLPEASRSFTCSGEVPSEYPMWRFGAFHHHVLTHTNQAPDDDFNWAEDIVNFQPEVLVVAGTCGAAGANFQQTYNLEALPRARFTIISGAGHLTLFLDYAEETLAALRAYLIEYY